MRGRSAVTPRPVAYPRCTFGTYLGELIDAHPTSRPRLAERIGVSPGNLSNYRHGRYLPPDRKAIGVIARVLAPTSAQQPEIRAELTRRWIADLLDVHLRGGGVSMDEARLAIRDLARR